MGQECVSCFIPINEIANFKLRDEDNATLILFVYSTSTAMLYPTRYIRQRGVFVSQFILFKVFADTGYVMSATSPYAFLVTSSKHLINADFGGLIGK